jgi:hypothetical protein
MMLIPRDYGPGYAMAKAKNGVIDSNASIKSHIEASAIRARRHRHMDDTICTVVSVISGVAEV